ncbi:hypothetical protein DKX38_007912 [Salix brachista]|uniref:Uncharacterized protein n=1 Tax=Salix brachista TaxID=2182728 RepID=A0A5N5MRD8_9ROSI|nr:hypothetical protein DKX38_007912 [Salix brachista]
MDERRVEFSEGEAGAEAIIVALIPYRITVLWQTWWQQHFLLVVLACVCAVAFIFGSLAFGIWFTWGHRQQALNPYKPVDAVVPEQELQPL